MSVHSRDYQQVHIDARRRSREEGHVSSASNLATGLGKGNIIGELADVGTLVLSHREDINLQLVKRIKKHHPNLSVGLVQGQRDESRRDVVVASMQTLVQPGRFQGLRKITDVFIDECHRGAAKSYVDILTAAGCFAERDPTPYYGLTATMMRGAPPKRGEKGLGDIFPHILEPTYDIQWGVTHGPAPWDEYVTVGVEENGGVGWLSRPYGVAVRTDHVDLEQVKRNGKGDFQDKDLGVMVRQDAPQIVAAWFEHAVDAAHPAGRITVAFWPDVATAVSMAEAFNLAGVPSRALTSGTTRTERGEADEGTGIYGALARGEIRILHAVMVPTEGWDCRQVECVLWGRPTLLPGLYAQAIGRGLRPSPQTGKRDCLVLDVVGTSRRLGLVLLPQLLKGVEYDATEVADAAPCDQCLQPIALCECEPEERGPRIDRRPRPLQPVYDEVDLFAATEFNWRVTEQGFRFLSIPRTRQYLVLYPEHNATVSVGLLDRDGRGGRWEHENLSPSLAQRLGEAKAEEVNAGGPGMKRSAPWRTGRASEAAVAQGARMGIVNAEQMTAGRLADEIDRKRCTAAMARALSVAA